MEILHLAVVVVLTTTVLGQNLKKQTCSTGGNQATIQSGAKAFIGGLVNMHYPGSGGYGCGKITEGEMQAYEAIRWALDRLNKKGEVLNGENLTDSYIPGVDLGMKVRDYCDSSSVAITKAQDFYPQLQSEDRDCVTDTGVMLGLTGASSSRVTKDLFPFTGKFNVPLVSYMSTAQELTAGHMYPNFMRTISPDGPLMDAIVMVLGELKWKYVVVVYTEDTYGRGSVSEIRSRLEAAGICLTMAVGTDPTDTSTATLQNVINKVKQTDTVGAIFLGNTNVALGLLEAAETQGNAGKLQWIFTDSIPLSSKFTGKKYPRGIISVMSGSRKITEFEDHWIRINVNNPSLENPWYQDWYMSTNNCKIPGTTNPDYINLLNCPPLPESSRRNAFVQDQFVEPAVHAVFSYAYAFKEAHKVLCNGVRGLCPALETLSTEDFFNNYLRKVDFTYTKKERVESLASVGLEPYNAAAKVAFDANGDIVNPSYDVYNFNDYQSSSNFKFWKIGSFLNGRLEIVTSRLRMYDSSRDKAIALPPSNCPSTGCTPCLGTPVNSKYMYVPGDIVINGIFSVHGAGSKALSCGPFNEAVRPGIQYLEGMFYALNRVNSKTGDFAGILPGVTLGGLGFDDCASSVLSTHLVTEVQRYARPITDTSGNVMDPRTVESYIGAYSSSLTIPLSELMNEIKRPLVGYAGISTELADDPYYIYMSYNSELYAKAFIYLMKQVGWNYVQTVQGPYDYSRDSVKVFKKLAADAGICVVASYELMTDGDSDSIIKKLEKHSSVQPVLVVAPETHLISLLDTVKSHNKTGSFSFIAAILGKNNLYTGHEAAMEGLIGLDIDRPSLGDFNSYLDGLNPDTYKTNPWFNEWYEIMHQCSLDATNMRSYTTTCSSTNIKPVTNGGKFQLNIDAYTSIFAVYAIAHGLHDTLKFFCGDAYNSVCGTFMNAPNKGEKLVENIKNSAFTVGRYTVRFYEGQADFPIKYLNFRQGDFVSVGEYNARTNSYSLSEISMKTPSGVRPSAIKPTCSKYCLECLYIFSEQEHMYVPGDIIIPGILDVHYPGEREFLCGDVRLQNGFMNTEAVAFALQYINTGLASIKLSNVTLGSLLFDGCMDSIRGSTIAAALYYGLLPTEDGSPKYALDKMLGFMSYDSATTVDLAGSLGHFGIPLVTPGADTPLLDDKTMYKTFFRTIPSGSLTSRAMAKAAKSLGFKYIITLNAPDKGSRDAMEKFRMYARAQDICIGASYEFGTDGSMATLIGYIADSSTRVVAVFSDPDKYIEDLLKAKSQNVYAANIVFLANRHWDKPVLRFESLQLANKALTFGMEVPKLDMFRDYLRTKYPASYMGNPWFNEAYQQFFQCNLPGNYKYSQICSSPAGQSLVTANFKEDYTTLPTIHAVFSLAEAIHRTLKVKCGAAYSGVCAKFVSDSDTNAMIMTNMDALTVTDTLGELFKFIERESNQVIKVRRIIGGSSLEEGDYSRNDVLSLKDLTYLINTEYVNTPSVCTGDCSQCINIGDGSEDFTYFSSDIMFVGLFDIRKKGNSPYTCGEINDKHGFQLLEAFHFAMEYANNRTGIFKNLRPGVVYGGLALDVCQNPTRAGNLVANLHSGKLKLTKRDIVVNPNRVDAYIGPLDSETTIRVADVVNPLGIPQISYGATTMELRDGLKYRYFLRTVPADDKQARAVISYLKMFDLFNVQVISSYSSVGESGLIEFARLARLNRICISQNITTGKSGIITQTDALTAVNKLFLKPDATAVVLFVDDPEPLLKVIENSFTVRNNFTFIGTDKLGYDRDKWNNARNLMNERRAVTFDIETADYPEFDKYLDHKTPDNYDFNPWFDEYYQMIFRCNLPGQIKYSNPCPTKMWGISRSNYYTQDPYVLYVVNAVFSAIFGVDRAIKDLCPPDTIGLCNLFRTSGERRQLILERIKQVSFIDNTLQPFYYMQGGDSSRGYHIWEPIKQGQTSDYILEDVGSYNDTHYLKIDARYDVKWVSNCERPDSCKCVFPDYKPSRFMKTDSDHGLSVVYISDIHSYDPYNQYGCGAIDTAGQFQNLLAFFYALKLVNSDPRLPATLKMGGVALDTCSTPNKIGQDIYSLLSGEGICGSNVPGQVVTPSELVAYVVKNSDNSLATSSILSPLKYTTISPSATTVALSNKDFHSYFLRTVPPDNIQAVVISKVMQRFGWDYVSAVYTDNAYGNAAIKTLLKNSESSSPRTCVAQTQSLPVRATLRDARDVINKLNQRVGARVVVLFVTAEHARLLLQATTERGITHRFLWLGSDTWGSSQTIVKGFEDAASGAITIQIKSEVVEGFRTFIKSLNFTNRLNMPRDWFEDLYQTLHQCRILNSVVPKDYNIICDGNEVITDAMIPDDPFTLQTIISVYMIANGINSIEECKRTTFSLSACLSLQKNARELIYENILGTQYAVLPDDLKEKSFNFKFTDSGYGDIGYNILNYKRDLTSGQFSYAKIGSYQEELTLDKSLYQSVSFVGTGTVPLSECPLGSTCPCLNSDGSTTGYKREGIAGVSYIRLDDGSYIDAQTGEVVQVEEIPDIADRFRDIWGIIVGTLAGIGLIASLCMFIYLLVMYPVRGGTSVLGYMLSFGIILMYAMVFPFILHANRELCGLRQFCLGFVYSICYSVLFVKLVDSWRSKNKDEISSVKYEKLGHPLGLFFSAVLLVLVQVIINAEWLILQEPGLTTILNNQLLWPRCTPNDFYDESLILSLVYIMVLIVLCILFGLCAWNNEKNHKDSRWVMGISVLSLPVWVVFCVVAILGDIKMRDAAIAIGLLINATIMLLLGPMRKLYLLSQYEAKIEEEERQSALGSQKGADYSSMYGRQYDNLPQMQDSDSMRGSVVDRGNNGFVQYNGSTRY